MKRTHKLLSILLCCAMLLGMLPMTAMAAEATEITEIKSVISAEHVPKAGMEVDLFMPNVPDGEHYSRPWTGADWYDSNGVRIAPTVNHHYDLGYEFEAGHTYYADYQYTASDGYVFAQNPTITLTGPDPSMFTYEIIDRWDNNESVTVRYTFTIPGDYENADINKVSMQYYGTPKDGGKKPDRCELIYNNCTITSEEWNTGTWGSDANWGVYEEDGSNAPTFLEGETYVHMIELTAKAGYKFSAGLHVQKGTQDAEEYGVVSLSADRTVATVKFTYEIPEIEIINTIELVAANQHMNFCLRSGESIYLPQPFVPKYVLSADCPYEVENVNSCDWINDETGEYLELGYPHTFENAKKYTLRFHVRIKDEFESTHKFASGTDLGLNVTDYAYANSNFVDFKISGGETTATVEVTFTVQFPEGAGSSAGNPAFCYSYEEFKYAMENDDIRYVALGNIDETMPVGEEGLVTAIRVNGIKTLNLLGDATFTAPASTVTTYAALLHVTNYNTLNISGAGSLTFRAVASNSYNAVIYNQGGMVNISGGTLIGSYNTAVYGKAIWQEYGELRITGGQFFAENALAPGRLPAPKTAVYINGGQAWIQGGTFRTDNVIDTIDLPYGLDIGQYATVDLSGGTYHGILLPTSSTPLANYMDEDIYTPLSDERAFNPESEYSQEYVESGKVVRIAWLIDHVDVHINAPIAGVDITENYFNIPTSGCKVTMYYPQWYKNGDSITYGTFEAGASYKVVVWVDAKADYGAEFTNGVTVAINNQSVAVDRKSEHLIAVEYDFGVCPNVVPEVELTVTAPKEGEYPSYTIGCGSDAYYAVGGSSNYTDYRTWYWSSDNDEWYEMGTLSNGEKMDFWSGYYYKLVVDIRTNNGYEFPLIDVGTIQPDVTATVNGYAATVHKAYEQDPSRYITVEYNFGECSDSVVERITVENVTEPVAGQKPNYNWAIRGTGYQMDTAKNAYYDAYWKNPPEQWYYVKNGLQWWDATTGSWDYVYENDTFIPGHTYVCQLYLVVEDGFTFAVDKYNAPTVTATINGKAAEINEGWTDMWNARVYYTFTCKQPEINTVMLYNLDAPVAGETPDTDVTAAYPEFYEVTNVQWLDEEDGVVNSFEQGRLYTAEITVAPKDYSGVDGCIFAGEVTAYIDGTEVTGWSNTVTVNNDNTLTIRYSFRKPAQAPEIEYYFFLDQPSGGEVFAGEALNVSWSTTWIPTKTEIQYWDGQAWDQWDVQYPENKQDDYDFENVDAGSVQFRIVAYVGNEPRATSNEFIVTWKDPVSAVWSGDSCTVKLDLTESGVTVIAVSYRNGKMVKLEYLTKSDHTAVLTGDQVKIFYLYEATYLPVRKAAESQG